jgi:hypothetical protein
MISFQFSFQHAEDSRRTDKQGEFVADNATCCIDPNLAFLLTFGLWVPQNQHFFKLLWITATIRAMYYIGSMNRKWF